MVITDSDIAVILPALDVYVEYMEQIANAGYASGPVFQESADKAKSLKRKILAFEEYE